MKFQFSNNFFIFYGIKYYLMGIILRYKNIISILGK
jgi:hypothetical protein